MQDKIKPLYLFALEKMGESTVLYAVSTSDFSTKGQFKESRFI